MTRSPFPSYSLSESYKDGTSHIYARLNKRNIDLRVRPRPPQMMNIACLSGLGIRRSARSLAARLADQPADGR